MADAPKSYKDPYWSDLASGTEQKLGLPSGLLVAVLTKGERSNANQVSESGARTPFQVIPSTRDAVLKKYGVDAYLSPENAAEAAGLLLKESLQRNRGDVAAAVGEYHGGTDRANWGPRTRAYVGRVVPAVSSPVGDADIEVTPIPAGQPSTFDRVRGQMAQPQANAIANVYAAYQAGRMTPQEAQEFEQDVQAGRVMLPRGASLKQTQGGGAMQLPAGVVDAYVNGRMTPQERSELEQDVAAGRVALPAGMQQAQGGGIQAAIPGAPTMQPAQQPEPSLGQKLLGAGEAALTTATGMTGGAVGAAGGLVKGVAQSVLNGTFGTREAADLTEQAMADGANALTYQPRTPTGQDYAENVGQVMQQVLPGAVVAHGMMPPGATAPARAAAVDAARAVPGVAAEAGRAVVQKAGQPVGYVRDMVFGHPAEQTPTPGTMGSAGAAGTDMATQRRALAESLGFTGDAALTKGQASRNAAQLKFEVETAKLPDEGATLRQRRINQNAKVLENFDGWIDETGAEAPTLRAVGTAVDEALVKQSKRDKTEVNVAYAKAKKSPEAVAVVDQSLPVKYGAAENEITATPIDFINEQPAGLPSTGLVDAARQYAVKLGVADLRDGQLVPREGVTVRQMEDWRKAINQATGYEPTDIRSATILKALIDGQTEPVAGPLYQQARALRARYAQNYENRATIAKLLNVKRGTQDRQVALEDVFDHVVMKGSLDDVKNARRVLQRSGPEGQQAWRELQGATLRRIRDEASKNIAKDSAGNAVISPRQLRDAIVSLDSDGKLEFIFGKQGAQRMRDIADLVQESYTVPPESAINHANTAMTLLMAFGDLAASGATGVPAPLATGSRLILKQIKSRQLRARIADALDEANRKQRIQRNQPQGRP